MQNNASHGIVNPGGLPNREGRRWPGDGNEYSVFSAMRATARFGMFFLTVTAEFIRDVYLFLCDMLTS